jgi:prepilin-type processing-associated H-X9-DG protein
VALLLPAIQAAREAARRSQCVNNLKQLSLAHLNYESTFKGLLPMAKHWISDEYDAAHTNHPGNWYDNHGWYIPLMPYIEQAALENLANPNLSFSDPANYAARTTFVATHACPSDIGLTQNEFPPAPNYQNWARVRSNYVVNAGNTVYGQHDLSPTDGIVHFGGAPFAPKVITPLAKITDGTANTLMMSEILILPDTGVRWGGAYSDAQTALGGQVFTGWNTPNSGAADALARMNEWFVAEVQQAFLQVGLPYPPAAATSTSSGGVPVGGGGRGGGGGGPTVAGTPDPLAASDGSRGGASGTKQQRISARSRHPGGVNASRCDGSVSFYTDDIDLTVWRALSTAWAGDLANVQ